MKLEPSIWVAIIIYVLLFLAVLFVCTTPYTYSVQNTPHGGKIEATQATVATTTPEYEAKVSVPLPYEQKWSSEQLKRICACESTGNPNAIPVHHNEDGSVLRGRINPKDIGMCQINEYYHGEAAQSMGIDIYSKQGNKEYAEHLYKTQGSQPWLWSEHCWQ